MSDSEQISDQQVVSGAQLDDMLANAHIQKDRRNHDRAQPSRRREARLAIEAKAKLSSSMATGFEGILIDISTNGCSFHSPGGSFCVGDQVWLRLDNMQPWRGSVRWIADDRIGVEFNNPFYPAVVEHLVLSQQRINCNRAA